MSEGGTVSVSASGSDPENSTLSFTWDLDNNGSFETAGQSDVSGAALAGLATRTIAYRRRTKAG